MTFSDALNHMRYGDKTLRRAAWPIAKCLKVEQADLLNPPEFLFINADEPGPVLSEEDILRDDWQLVVNGGVNGG